MEIVKWYLSSAENNGLWKVRKRSGQFWLIQPTIPTWNQNTCQGNLKDPNNII